MNISKNRENTSHQNQTDTSNTPVPDNITPNQQQFNFKLSSLKVRDENTFPIELDVLSEVQNILASGIFRNIENPIVYEKLCDMMMGEDYTTLTESLFWTIHVMKFQKDDQELLEGLRKRLGFLYSEYFSLLPQPKEELSNMGIFGAAYLCHIIFFHLFPNERKTFDMRFILDCYHIVIHEVNGILVSDYYIQNAIEKFFGNKFFHYEKRAEKKKKVEKRDFRTEPLLQGLNYDLKHLPSVPGGLDLAHELASKLRRGGRKLKGTAVHLSTNTDLNESNLLKDEKILKLTQQQQQDQSFSSHNDSGHFFPKLKFNCHQISPTVSNFLDNPNNTLPFQKRKVIQYSSNQHMADTSQLIYHPNLEPNHSRSEKKDKKKSQLKGEIPDYELKNRADDYYLGYMPRDIKNKFKLALDIKYIMDNVKVNLRGSHSIKGFFKEKNSLFPLKDADTRARVTIPEEQEDEKGGKNNHEGNTEKEDVNSSGIAAVELFREISEKLGQPALERKNTMAMEERSNDSILPLIKSKLKATLAPELSFSKSGSMRKGLSLIKKTDELLKISKVEDDTLHEDAFKYASPERMKYSHFANRKLGKGKFFVDLAEREEDVDQEHQRRFGKKVLYEDKRKKYVSEHDPMIKKDVDSNIDHLVRSLMTKQNVFNKSFGRRKVVGA